MKYFAIAVATTITLALGAVPVSAQHYRRSAQATVDTIDVPTRILELKRAEGYYIRLHVPDALTKFDSLKVGDTVNIVYTESVIKKVEKAGDVVHNREEVLPPNSQEEAHGNPDLLRITTGTLTDIGAKYGNVTYTDPTGRPYMARVESKDVTKGVKVGDKVDVTYSQATLYELK